MPATVPASFAIIDCFYSLGLGLLLSLVYTVLHSLLGHSKLCTLISDVLICIAIGIVYISVITGRSYGGIARWYTLGALLCGYLSWQVLTVPLLRAIKYKLQAIIRIPLAYIHAKIIVPLAAHITSILSAYKLKRRARRNKANTKKVKQLQSTAKVLYNSNYDV